VLPPHCRPIVAAFPVDNPLNYQQLLPQIREVAPWNEPYVLVAESFSGPLALYFAQAQWENIEAIVLCGSFARNPLPPFLNWVYSLLGPSLFKKVPPATILKKYLAGHDAPASLMELITKAIRSVKPEVLSHRVELVMQTDATQALQDCRAPILFLLGSRDELVGRRGWESLVKARPDITCVEIDAPHLILQTKPREAWVAIEMFLKQLVPA
jgi:pimeloyl-ACP methyl ester carboxylesterase